MTRSQDQARWPLIVSSCHLVSWEISCMYAEFFINANELIQRGEPFVTATVVRAEKPTSAKPGDKAIVAGGALHGWIGGSCAQPTVLAEAQRALADGQPRLIRLSTEPDAQAARAGLTDLPM